MVFKYTNKRVKQLSNKNKFIFFTTKYNNIQVNK